jgi:signal transduction histidine kinase
LLRPSLRLRVLLLIVAINVAVVGAETWVLVTRLARDTKSEREALTEDLVFTLREKLQPEAAEPEQDLADELERLLEVRRRDAAGRSARAFAGALAWRALDELRPLNEAAVGPLFAWTSWRSRSPELLSLAAEFEREIRARSLAAESTRWRSLASELATRAVARLAPRAGLNVAPLLSWPNWERFEDAILLDRNLELNADGKVTPLGIALNPLGRARRAPEFDEQAVYAAIDRSIKLGKPIDDVANGRVVPIEGSGPQGVFGACWYLLPRGPVGRELLFGYVLPAFAFSSLLLIVGTFVALRRFVLDPVERLARGARAVAAGDITVRVVPPEREDELARLIRTFNEMTARVAQFSEELEREVQRATLAARRAEATAMTQRRLAAMGELAAGIAHEINNPLGGLVNAAEVLGRADLEPARRQRYVELLAGGLERIRRTVGQLLRFTPRSAKPELLAVHQPVLDAVALVRHRANQLGVELAFACEGQVARDVEPGPELEQALQRLPVVRGEAHEIAQAVLNLLVNALDALEEQPDPAGGARRGHVAVELGQAPGWVWIEVADDGPGVAPDVLERASDLYFTTKAPGRGTGLGHAIGHTILAPHRGRVDLWSQLGQGFRARVELPAVDLGAERRESGPS